MSRLNRLSARAYGRMTSEQKRAVDLLRYANLSAADRGEAKTTLRWRRTAAETIAYANRLIEDGLTLVAAANRLGVDRDHLVRLLNAPTPEDQVRKPTIHPPDRGVTDKTQVIARPAGRKAQERRPAYSGRPILVRLRRCPSEGEADAVIVTRSEWRATRRGLALSRSLALVMPARERLAV